MCNCASPLLRSRLPRSHVVFFTTKNTSLYTVRHKCPLQPSFNFFATADLVSNNENHSSSRCLIVNCNTYEIFRRDSLDFYASRFQKTVACWRNRQIGICCPGQTFHLLGSALIGGRSPKAQDFGTRTQLSDLCVSHFLKYTAITWRSHDFPAFTFAFPSARRHLVIDIFPINRVTYVHGKNEETELVCHGLKCSKILQITSSLSKAQTYAKVTFSNCGG